MSDNSETPMKTCSNPNCDVKTYPATAEYFYRSKGGKYGLAAKCKKCSSARTREWNNSNRERKAERNRQYYQANKEKRAEYNREYHQANKEKTRERSRRWREANKERKRLYYQANKEKWQQYRLVNPRNPEKTRMYWHSRRARKRELPDTLTTEQWLQCLEYHDYRCAVCRNQFRDLFETTELHQDHWLPFASELCLGTTADNTICLCSTCNLSKSNKLPDVWLKERYTTRQANKILKRIEAYFDYVRANMIVEESEQTIPLPL